MTIDGLRDGVEDPVAVLVDASLHYGGRVVLDAVSLILRPGEIYVLMGPNGSGKTSVVNLLTGRAAAAGGTVSVEGLSVPSSSRKVAVVPQDIALYSWLTAAENCRAFARIDGLGGREAAERAAWALDLAGCRQVADTRIGKLSGGYKRRVNIAAAMARNPRLLILDEATVGLDRGARQAIAETLTVLRARGTAIFMVTHNFDEADALADRVGFLLDGRLVGEGEPRRLIGALHGSRKEIQLVLDRVPNDHQGRRLREKGAVPAANGDWLVFLDLEHWDVGRFLADLRGEDIAIKEVRMRDPGLTALYAHFCGAGQPA